MHTVFALLCFVLVIHWLILPYPSGLLHWHCGNLTIAPVPAKQPWWIWINTSCEFIVNDCITTPKQSTTKPCAYFLGYTDVHEDVMVWILVLSEVIHGLLVYSQHKGSVIDIVDIFIVVSLHISTFGETIEWPVIWDAGSIMWCPCDKLFV